MNYNVERGHLNKPIYTDSQKEYIIREYTSKKDVSLFSLSKLFNVSPPTLKKLLIEEGIPLKTISDYRKIYDLNEKFFDVIDTEEKAYWLGFLYADGVVNEDEGKVRINLSSKDRSHLEKFRRSLKSTHPIKSTSKKTKEKTYYGNYISFSTRHMTQSLVDKGCYQRKSGSLMFPMNDIVPDNLIHHFIRGYFDGDGSISYTTKKGKYLNRRLYRIGIMGTDNIVDNIKYVLNSTVKTEKKKNVSVVQMGGNQQCKRIFEYLYKDATVYLERKHDIFQEMLKYIEDNAYTAWNKNKTYTIHNNEVQEVKVKPPLTEMLEG